MAQEYQQFRHGDNEAKRQLEEHLAREEMGDAAYDKQVSYYDDRAFKIFGVIFIAFLAAVVLAVAWLGD